jgi:NAD(P)-dependent dehydrogenase (short-subunit alcohol dehydrogenase family)
MNTDQSTGPIALVTGANRGLGHETARRLRDAGHTVIIGSRNPANGRAVAAEYVALDVTRQDSIQAAAHEVRRRHGHLDILVNNAGIAGPGEPVEQVDADAAAEVIDINLLGVIRVTNAFLPLLKNSSNPRIVNVTSGLGSFGRTHDHGMMESQVPPMVYAATKAALNMLTVQYARSLPQVRINAADPGYTATDMNGGAASGGHSVHDGTDAIITLATLPIDGPSGQIIDRDGYVPW